MQTTSNGASMISATIKATMGFGPDCEGREDEHVSVLQPFDVETLAEERGVNGERGGIEK